MNAESVQGLKGLGRMDFELGVWPHQPAGYYQVNSNVTHGGHGCQHASDQYGPYSQEAHQTCIWS